MMMLTWRKATRIAPTVRQAVNEKRELQRPWARSLIIHLFDRDPVYIQLERQLEQKWALKGTLTLVDIGNDYYIAKFTNKDDFYHVQTQGPWMIGGNYLMIRRWTTNFNPYQDVAQVLTAWIRMLGLSMEYFHEGYLRQLGSLVELCSGLMTPPLLRTGVAEKCLVKFLEQASGSGSAVDRVEAESAATQDPWGDFN
ncbi:hypothetical protein V2J09_008612 [Rumex salicifolius]